MVRRLSTLIGNVLADIAMGRKNTNPLDGMPWNAFRCTRASLGSCRSSALITG
jgi:hypothetical protein